VEVFDDPHTRAERSALLAHAEASELTALADEFLAAHGAPTVTVAPQTGLVMMQVREPVAGHRFHLGEVLVTRAEVDWNGAVGWSMRLGTDRAATLAAAVCDAAAEVDATSRVLVDEFCRRVADRDRERSEREWSELLTTAVAFEELD
jgi:alpha-D-ribose 1-methylphosphonate 5-triphosphate synthase subunit PhnG